MYRDAAFHLAQHLATVVSPPLTSITIVSANSSGSISFHSAPNATTWSTGTQCSEFWSTVYYESDGIPTKGSTACSCTVVLTSAEATYGTYGPVATWYNNYSSTWETTTYIELELPLPDSYSVPKDCCVKCGVTAKDVRLIYWPIKTTIENATSNMMTAIPTPYGVVSDGFTLLVGFPRPSYPCLILC